MTEEEFRAAFPLPPRGGDGKGLVGWSKPVLSDALAVHPDQIPEAIEDAKYRGVPTEFSSDGRPVIRSAAHKRAYLKAYGFKDRNCFN